MSRSVGAWEATLATALRDTQWMAKEQGVLPGFFATLAGKVEAGKGDTVFQADDRIFIFELKASRSEIRSEWNRNVPLKDEDGKFVYRQKQKALHLWTINLLAKWCEAVAAIGDRTRTWDNEIADHRDLVLLSLRAHHFVYWDDHAVVPGDRMSGMLVAPYLRATLEEMCMESGSSTEVLGGRFTLDDMHETLRSFFSLRRRSHAINGTVATMECDAVDVLSLYTKTAWLADLAKKQPHMLGLSFDEFQTYTSRLPSLSPGEDRLNAVVLGTQGFYRCTKSVNDLKTLFTPGLTMSLGNKPNGPPRPRL